MTLHRTNILLGIIIAASAVTLALALSRLTWHAQGHVALNLNIPDSGQNAISQAKQTDLTPILALAPFGAEQQAATGAAEVSVDLDKLTLHAVMHAIPYSLSTAAISVEGAQTTSFRSGEIISSGITLKHIGPSYVLLQTARGSQRLGFDIRGLNTSSNHPSPNRNAATRANIIADGNASADAMIEHYRQQITADPKSVMTALGVTATDEGYRISPSAPAAVLRTGLRPGDLITRVNGEQVGNVQSDRALFEKIAASGHARVELRRGNNRITLSFPLQ